MPGITSALTSTGVLAPPQPIASPRRREDSVQPFSESVADD
jgi:hypothetical protein